MSALVHAQSKHTVFVDAQIESWARSLLSGKKTPPFTGLLPAAGQRDAVFVRALGSLWASTRTVFPQTRPVARGLVKICGPLVCRWSVLPLTAAPGNTDQGGRLASSPGAFAPSHSQPSQKSADGVPEWIARVATNNRWFRALRRQSGWRTCCQTIQHYAPAPTAQMSAQSGSWQSQAAHGAAHLSHAGGTTLNGVAALVAAV